ncbi:MAG: zinc ribbon domain-containing protein [Lachnospiraceae bacterium]|nr:zinc ribbon domain-containing protein [Lachnospiraceae bacterium]
MFCTNCGKQLPDGSMFCTYCGTRLKVSAPAKAAAAAEDLPKAEDLENKINNSFDSVIEEAAEAAKPAPAAAPVFDEIPEYQAPKYEAPKYEAPKYEAPAEEIPVQKPARKAEARRDEYRAERPAPAYAAVEKKKGGINPIAAVVAIIGAALVAAFSLLPFMDIYFFKGNLFDAGYGIFFTTIGILGIISVVLKSKIFYLLHALAAVAFTVWLIFFADFIFSDAKFQIGFFLMIAGAAVMLVGAVLMFILKGNKK